MTTIQNGKKALIDSIATVGEVAEINGDLSSDKWKNSQLNSSKENVASQVSAMNAATAQLVKLIIYYDLELYDKFTKNRFSSCNMM